MTKKEYIKKAKIIVYDDDGKMPAESTLEDLYQLHLEGVREVVQILKIDKEDIYYQFNPPEQMAIHEYLNDRLEKIAKLEQRQSLEEK
jgi:hypothetical protein